MTRIAVFGHRGLTAEVAAFIDGAVREQLAEYGGADLVGVCCLADGADQIFARAVLDAGGTLEAFVPTRGYRDQLPEQARGGDDDLLARASRVRRLDHVESNSTAHMDASVEMLKSADLLIAVWDGQPSRGFGGTADVVAYARRQVIPVVVVWPDGAHRDRLTACSRTCRCHHPDSRRRSHARQCSRPSAARRIRADPRTSPHGHGREGRPAGDRRNARV
jgi:hypothetical protein